MFYYINKYLYSTNNLIFTILSIVDVDECAEKGNLCPREQPDCVNTAGAYLCICYEYDNITNTCKGKGILNYYKYLILQ